MVPVLGGNVLQSLNGSVNQFWVSHTLGVSAITAIGNANFIMFMLLSAIFGISMAANILVAQAVGAGDMTMVKRVMGTAVIGGMLASTVIAIFIIPVGFYLVERLVGSKPHAPKEAGAEQGDFGPA